MEHRSSQESAPAINALLVGEVERHLRRREAAKQLAVLALLAVGLPALFLGPIVISSIFWMVGILWGFYLPWTWVFAGSFVLLVPLLFRTERRTGGNYYADSVLANRDTSAAVPMFLLAFTNIGSLVALGQRPRDPAIALVELFLWGPRQILDAVRTLRGVRMVAAANRSRVVNIFLALRTCDHADIPALFPGGDAEGGLALAYLLWYGWIGVSKDASRVWLESESRKVGEMPPHNY